MNRLRLPSPAMVVAVLALLVALSGTAVAAGVIPPLAKRALVADNAKKFSGLTLGQVGAGLTGLVSVKSAPWSLNLGEEADFTVACATGEKALSGGYDNPSGIAFPVDTRPNSDDTAWKLYLANGSKTAPASGTLYVICLV